MRKRKIVLRCQAHKFTVNQRHNNLMISVGVKFVGKAQKKSFAIKIIHTKIKLFIQN